LSEAKHDNLARSETALLDQTLLHDIAHQQLCRLLEAGIYINGAIRFIKDNIITPMKAAQVEGQRRRGLQGDARCFRKVEVLAELFERLVRIAEAVEED
jgi:hypothetical protein